MEGLERDFDYEMLDRDGAKIEGFSLVTDEYSLRKMMSHLRAVGSVKVCLFRGRGLDLKSYRDLDRGDLRIDNDDVFCFQTGNNTVRFGLDDLRGEGRFYCLFFEDEVVANLEGIETGDSTGRYFFYNDAGMALSGLKGALSSVRSAVDTTWMSPDQAFLKMMEWTKNRSFMWLNNSIPGPLLLYIPIEDFRPYGEFRIGANVTLKDEDVIVEFLRVLGDEYPILMDTIYDRLDGETLEIAIRSQPAKGTGSNVVISIVPVDLDD